MRAKRRLLATTTAASISLFSAGAVGQEGAADPNAIAYEILEKGGEYIAPDPLPLLETGAGIRNELAPSIYLVFARVLIEECESGPLPLERRVEGLELSARYLSVIGGRGYPPDWRPHPSEIEEVKKAGSCAAAGLQARLSESGVPAGLVGQWEAVRRYFLASPPPCGTAPEPPRPAHSVEKPDPYDSKAQIEAPGLLFTSKA